MKYSTQFYTRWLLVFLFLGGVQAVSWSQRVVKGTVKDAETGETLIGVTILEKGTPSNGAVSDIDGNFSIKVTSGATMLVTNYTGYPSAEHDITGKDYVEITLSGGVLLQEVVKIGYGTVKREDATGVVQSVTTSQFNKGQITGPQELLAGKIAGVVVSNDPSPGGGAQIRIRGESSLSAGKDPLIVVDGVPLDNTGVAGGRNALNIINPNDIESITVLKDASSAAIYGNRASAGVIMITTKKGKLGKKISVDYNANLSISQTANRVDMLTADEFRQAIHENYYDPNDPDHPALGLVGDDFTDWQDQIYRTAIGQDHTVSLSGGVGVVPYRLSLGFTDRDGLLKTDNFKRYTAGINLNPGFFNNTLQLNIGVKAMLNDNHFADRAAIGNALSYDPTKPVRDTSFSRFGGYHTWVNNVGNPNPLAQTNPVALLELRDDNSTVKRYITSAAVDYRLPFLPALRLNLNLAYDYSKGEGTVVVPNYAAFSFDAINGGGVNNFYEQERTNKLLETYANYKKSFGKTTVDAMAGYSWQEFRSDNYSKNSDSAGTPAETTEFTDILRNYLVSLYGRVNLGFADRFLLTGSLRRDGSSRFSPDYRWGLFPAGAFAVKIVDNDDTYFNFVKARIGVGITGQQDIGDESAYLAKYQIGQSNAQYQFGNEFYTTYRPNGYVLDIQWEKTTTYNLGVDYSLIKNRFSGSVDVYQRDTRDLLNYIPVPALSNLTNYVTTNIGNMTTQGIELGFNTTPVVKEKVRWDFSANVAYNINEITKLTNNDTPENPGVLTGGIAGGVGSNIQVHTVNYAPSSFYVYKQLYDENGNILEGQYADLNGDSIVNDQDKYRFKQPAPRVAIGLTSSLTVHNFDFSFAGRANLGQYVYNNVKTDMGYLNRLYATTNYLTNVHQSAVDLNVFTQGDLTFSDHFVTNASFFRLDHVTVGYTFNKLIGNYLRVYGTVQNPLVITKYDGLDPEIGNGIDNQIYPRPIAFVFGLNVNF